MNSSSHGLTEERMVTAGNQEEFFKLYYHNGVYMGEVIMNDDGYYVFFPDKERAGGYWSQGDFLALYKYLEEKNKYWDDQLNEFFR